MKPPACQPPPKPLKHPDGSPARLAPLELPAGDIPVILSLGMGLESIAILIRWLLDESCRDFDLRRLVVLSAQVGHEGQRTKDYMERYVLPILCRFGIRYIQASRAGPSVNDGVIVLSDTDEPEVCYVEGCGYSLLDELLGNGTVPQVQRGRRTCSLKHKGFVLDTIIRHLVGDDQPFVQAIGFNRDEGSRITRDQSFAAEAMPRRRCSYPLADWQWGRDECEAYLVGVMSAAPPKSACGFCPFACGSSKRDNHMLPRYRENPAEGAITLLIEHVAGAINPKMTLYGGTKTAQAELHAAGNDAAFALLNKWLAASDYALYRVRRIYYAPAVADRSVQIIVRGNAATCRTALERLAAAAGATIVHSGVGDHPRAYLRHPDVVTSYPTLEEQYVVAPAYIQPKQVDRFETTWTRLTQGPVQLEMFDQCITTSSATAAPSATPARQGRRRSSPVTASAAP